MSTVAQVPSIQQQPRTVADSAIHYGYIAYKEIFVGDRWVQPRHDTNQSPYWEFLPARQLIPFSNIDEPTPNVEVTSVQGTEQGRDNVGPQGHDKSVTLVLKTAKRCMEEVEWAYAEWGFVGLHVMTGFSEADAFAIFQTIQPFLYKLSELENELYNNAPVRLRATAPYTVKYGQESVELQPLPAELKVVALKVLSTMQESATRGSNLAIETIAKTKQSMTQFYATGNGKRLADPHDNYLFGEMGEAIPSLLSSQESGTAMVAPAPEDIELRRRELEVREQELDIRKRELALKEGEKKPDPFAAARAAKAAKAAEVKMEV
jgi:hypothetical protein